jgi:hypothetical protein
MIVMVDREEITGSLNRDRGGSPAFLRRDADGWPLQARGKGLGGIEPSTKLYAEYLRREGRDDGASAPRGMWVERSDSLKYSVKGEGGENGTSNGGWGERNRDNIGNGSPRERDRESARSKRSLGSRRTNGRNGGA